ncbi:MAG: hypothetical protein NTX50_22335 [Candidatus Sumerlaeota bacterium]|nr:hypothetical protein [Candidatus Sumerlaeota bacterium]
MRAFTSKPIKRAIFFSIAIFALCGISSAWAANEPPTAFQSLEKIALAMWTQVILFVILAVKAARIAGATLTASLWPELANRACERVAARPIQMFFLGLADALAGLLILWVLFRLAKHVPIFGLLGLAFFVLLILLTIAGCAGLYGHIGRQWSGGSDGPGAVMRGGIILEIFALIPVLGLLIEILIAIIGLGVGAFLLFEKPKARPLAADAPEAPAEAPEAGIEAAKIKDSSPMG